jgi:hypothetical protein
MVESRSLWRAPPTPPRPKIVASTVHFPIFHLQIFTSTSWDVLRSRTCKKLIEYMSDLGPNRPGARECPRARVAFFALHLRPAGARDDDHILLATYASK